eukprot:TRINITY_DN635_c0_g1_i1.p1 TRINITY_DN635_c0_g1~~TRINITY_DN635_c0_g1_i1.p1  ORF type:complete len:411 (+),score=65.93 TRINITY_DN635_c0_g1_i1:62-1294(+)
MPASTIRLLCAAILMQATTAVRVNTVYKEPPNIADHQYNCFNDASWCRCTAGRMMTGLKRTNGNTLEYLDGYHCARPTRSVSKGNCVTVSVTADFTLAGGTASCPVGTLLNGMHRMGCDSLDCVDHFECCRFVPLDGVLVTGTPVRLSWKACMDTWNNWCDAGVNQFVVGLVIAARRPSRNDIRGIDFAMVSRVYYVPGDTPAPVTSQPTWAPATAGPTVQPSWSPATAGPVGPTVQHSWAPATAGPTVQPSWSPAATVLPTSAPSTPEPISGVPSTGEPSVLPTPVELVTSPPDSVFASAAPRTPEPISYAPLPVTVSPATTTSPSHDGDGGGSHIGVVVQLAVICGVLGASCVVFGFMWWKLRKPNYDEMYSNQIELLKRAEVEGDIVEMGGLDGDGGGAVNGFNVAT